MRAKREREEGIGAALADSIAMVAISETSPGTMTLKRYGQLCKKANSGGIGWYKELKECLGEINRLNRWIENFYMDRCEGAYVEVTLLDTARAALAEVAPDHPFLKRRMPSFGVWEAATKRAEKAEAEVERLKVAETAWRRMTPEPLIRTATLAGLRKMRGKRRARKGNR